jgi:type IV pilus assembly protein PilA
MTVGVKRAVEALIAIAILGLIAALALPSYGEYTPRASVSAAVSLLLRGKGSLETACTNGTFAAKQKISDIGVPESELKASVKRVEFARPVPGTIRLKATLTDIYSHPPYWPFGIKAVSEGRSLEFDFTCAPDRNLVTRFAGSTLESKYLPGSLR